MEERHVIADTRQANARGKDPAGYIVHQSNSISPGGGNDAMTDAVSRPAARSKSQVLLLSLHLEHTTTLSAERYDGFDDSAVCVESAENDE
jgi:hypothetical protein